MSGHVHKNLNTFGTTYFYLDLCGRGLKTGFADRIHWFRVNGRPIRVIN